MKTDAVTYYAEQMIMLCASTLVWSSVSCYEESDQLAMEHLLTTIRNRAMVTGQDHQKGQCA